jgi:DhnA family fructose-bisphosphate aldolase class Ia
MPYFGPAAMQQLVAYDSSIIVGILGGPAGTTHDAFRMLWEAKKYGARAALFGRKINQAEDQLFFIEILRALADGNAEPEDAVRQYHAGLADRSLTPHRPLEEDLVLTQL